jgi:hypothetical protein
MIINSYDLTDHQIHWDDMLCMMICLMYDVWYMIICIMCDTWYSVWWKEPSVENDSSLAITKTQIIATTEIGTYNLLWYTIYTIQRHSLYYYTYQLFIYNYLPLLLLLLLLLLLPLVSTTSSFLFDMLSTQWYR